jgi:hypothetical protein
MTVAELIEKLKEMPQDAMVVVDGYAGGLDEVNSVKDLAILTDFFEESYYGAHEFAYTSSFLRHTINYDISKESDELFLFTPAKRPDGLPYQPEKEPFYCKCIDAVYISSLMRGYTRAERQL